MNIFILDYLPDVSAKYHVDRHVVKMITEQNQLLSSAHHISGTNPNIIPYKLTHKNHPCSKWIRTSIFNYNFLVLATRELCKEYTFRYGKRHKGEDVLNWHSAHIPNLPDIGLTPFAQAMPNEFKNPDPVIAYRNYYLGAKKHLFSWKNREVPPWINKEVVPCVNY